jgi:ABC-type polysaccharide/polyol phosphate transport system ATPase subunit
MSDVALTLSGVYKKFRKGELHDSLRDLIPALSGRLFRRAPPPELRKREFWALRDVSFSVQRGEAFGIIGANGAGKSTILKLLSRIMRPTRGSLQVQGRLSALIEVSAGFHPDLTGRENIYLNGTILGMTRAEIRRRFDAIVAFSGLEEFLDTPVKRYSSGMFARLGFAVAAHVQPDVMVVDEVLSIGDYLFQQKCIDRMNEDIRSGTTVVFVSHNLRAVSTLCARSLLLERGSVRQIGPTNEIIKAYLERAHDGRARDPERDISITKVWLGPADDSQVQFETDEYVDVVIEATARTPHKEMSVVLEIVDENQYPVFETCTERLGGGPLALGAGETLRVTFRVQLRLAQGTYHVNASLHRHVTSGAFDQWTTAATFFVAGTTTMRGVANLVPTLLTVDKTESDASRDCSITATPGVGPLA